MREMKDSGLKWIGEIPTAWKIMPNKYLMHKVKRICPIYDGEDILSLSMKGVIVRDLDAGGKMPKSFDGYQYASSDNLLMCLFDIDVTPRCIGIIKQDGLTSPAYSQFETHNIADARYYCYYYTMLDNEKTLVHLAKNLRHSLTEEQLGQISAIVPPIGEQKHIANFLDNRLNKVDDLIAEVQVQIDTLEQYKRSVITEAVTKGLNPDAEMKDSGIPWIGMMPAHWEAKKTKFLFEIVKRIAGREGFDVLSVTQKGLKVKDLTDYSGQIAENYSGYQFVYPTDYVMNHMDLLTGWVDCSKQFGVTSPDYRVFRLLSKDEHNLDYFKYIFQCLYMNKVYYSFGNGVSGLGRWRLQASTFLNFFLPVPPCAEQHQIASYISNKVLKINGIIDEKRNQLSVLDSYKKSLIFEYVTGKKKVPAATTPVTITAIDPHIILAGVAINGLGTRQLGKIQLEKALYLFDYYLGLGLSTQYYRFPHGPYDLSLDSYLAALQGNGWFKKISNFPEKYLAGENHCDFCEEAEKNSMLLNAKDGLDKVISFIKTMKKTSQVERVATLFAAWNDFLIDGITPSDDQIIREVMNNWTENKGNTQYLTWKSSLDKIKRSGIVPKGMGLHTLPMQEGGRSDA